VDLGRGAGNAYAQFDLAGLYMTGTGVQRDLVKAYSLFTLAGKTVDVSKHLSELSSKMSEDELAKFRVKTKWLKFNDRVSEVEGTSMHLRLGFVVSLVILLSMMALREMYSRVIKPLSYRARQRKPQD